MKLFSTIVHYPNFHGIPTGYWTYVDYYPACIILYLVACHYIYIYIHVYSTMYIRSGIVYIWNWLKLP